VLTVLTQTPPVVSGNRSYAHPGEAIRRLDFIAAALAAMVDVRGSRLPPHDLRFSPRRANFGFCGGLAILMLRTDEGMLIK
jgi:hypothetical protein